MQIKDSYENSVATYNPIAIDALIKFINSDNSYGRICIFYNNLTICNEYGFFFIAKEQIYGDFG